MKAMPNTTQHEIVALLKAIKKHSDKLDRTDNSLMEIARKAGNILNKIYKPTKK